MEFTGGHNLTFADLKSLTEIENTILADYDFGSGVLNNQMFSNDTYNSYIYITV